MRVLFLVAVLSAAGFVSSFAQRVVTTTPQPVQLALHNNVVNVLCATTDRNFNGTQDADDSPGAWLQIDPMSLQVIGTYTFPWEPIAASRVGWLPEKDELYICYLSTIERFTISNRESKGAVHTQSNGEILAGVTAYTGMSGTVLAFTTRPNFTDPGSLNVQPAGQPSPISIAVGVNPGYCARFRTAAGKSGILVANEGNFGKSNGTLSVSMGPNTTSLEMGDTPNHIAVSGDSAYVTVNGSHTVIVVDLNTVAIVDTIAVGTSGFDGPRESVVNNGLLYVSTYSSDVRIFNIASGERVGLIGLDAKPEGFLIAGRMLWVSRSLEKGGYSAVSDVAVYDLDDPTTVSDAPTGAATPRAIFATQSTVPLPFSVDSSMEIYTADGRKTTGVVVDSGRNTIDVSSLPRGTYVVSNGVQSITLMR